MDEVRADPVGSGIIASMLASGQAFLALETDQQDAQDVAAMQAVVSDLQALAQSEQDEPADDQAGDGTAPTMGAMA